MLFNLNSPPSVQKTVGEAGVFYARNGGDAFEQLLIKGHSLLRLSVSVTRKINLRRQHAFDFKARVSTATAVKPFCLHSIRMPKRRSCQSVCILHLFH